MLATNRHKTLALLLLSIAAVIGGHLLPGLDASRVEDGMRNGLHVVVFAGLAAVIFFLVARLRGYLVALVISILVSAVIGYAAELTQSIFDRELDYRDVGRDVAGATLAAFGLAIWGVAGRWRNSVLAVGAGRAVSTCLLALVFLPFAFWMTVSILGRVASPVIIDFSQWWHPYIYRPVNADITVPASSSDGASIALRRYRRSGLVISPLVTDWRAFEFLVIDAQMIAGEDATVTVRVNDRSHTGSWSDLYYASIVVGRSASNIRISLDAFVEEAAKESIDHSDIREIVFFVRNARDDWKMQLRSIRLE